MRPSVIGSDTAAWRLAVSPEYEVRANAVSSGRVSVLGTTQARGWALTDRVRSFWLAGAITVAIGPELSQESSGVGPGNA